MNSWEIFKLIDKKGSVVKDSFYSFYTTYSIDFDPKNYDYFSCNEAIAIFAYNCTILLLKKILENETFFEKEIGITKRKRDRIRKDLETMKRLNNYEIDYDDDYMFYEEGAISKLPTDNILF